MDAEAPKRTLPVVPSVAVAKTPPSILKHAAVSITTKGDAPVSSDAVSTLSSSSPPRPEVPPEPEAVEPPAAPTVLSDNFASPKSIVIDSRNYVEEGYNKLAKKRAQDEANRKAAEVRAAKAQARIDEQNSKAAAEEAARQQALAEQKQIAVENAETSVTQKEARPSIRPKDQKKKSLVPLLIILAVVLVLGAAGGGYYYKFGFSFPFFSEGMKAGEDNPPEKAGIVATPMAGETEPELGRIELAVEDAKLKGVGEADEIIATEVSQFSTNPEPVAAAEKNLMYHLTAGSFTVEQNARDLHEQLKTQGYESVYLGRIGNYYKVSYQSFKNEADAKAALWSLKDKGVSSWMISHELK